MFTCPVCNSDITDNNITRFFTSTPDKTKAVENIELSCSNHYDCEINSIDGIYLQFVETWIVGRYRIDINRSEPPFWICIYDKIEYHASGEELLQIEVDEIPNFKTEEDIQNWILVS